MCIAVYVYVIHVHEGDGGVSVCGSVHHFFLMDEVRCLVHQGHQRVEAAGPPVEDLAGIFALPEANHTPWAVNASINGLLHYQIREILFRILTQETGSH